MLAKERELMLTKIHQKLGTAGFVISIVALVAALGGGAYAASGGLTGKQKKEVEKIAKKYAGKPGAPGATGPGGASGAKGDKGDAGAAGTNGTNGTNGANGTSVTTTAFAGAKGTCTEGGVEVKSASGTSFVCNGEAGETGFSESLPAGKTLKGNWGFGYTPQFSENKQIFAPISFAIPVTGSITAVYVKTPGEEAANCPGSSTAPAAAPGFLCIYKKIGNAGVEFLGATVNEAGTVVTLNPEKHEEEVEPGVIVETFGPSFTYGTWAVTAPLSQ
jgi:hypothetical protein